MKTDQPTGCPPFTATTTRALAYLIFAYGLSSPLPAAVSFTPLGDLPGGGFASYAQGISADGRTIVGQGTTDAGAMAFRWSASGGMVGLGHLPGGGQASIARAVSSDGSVVVGQSDSTGSPGEAFRWTTGGGMAALGSLPNSDGESDAYAVSRDGTVVVGTSRTGYLDEAVRWLDGAGPERIHLFSGSYAYSGALAVSADGVIAGGFGVSPLTPGYQAFLWTNGDGMDLGVLPDAYSYSLVYGLSDLGDVAVGWSLSANGIEAIRWTLDTGMQAIPGLPGQTMGLARAVSGDGSIAVGAGYTDTGPQAFLWTVDSGTVGLAEFLQGNGVDIGSWLLLEAVALSADGSVIAGNGINPNGEPEAWVVNISVVTDSDGDGVNDNEDRFPNSDTGPVLMLGSKNTGVPNQVLADGATLADLIAACQDAAGSHGDFSSAVAHLTQTWVDFGWISRQQRAAIQKAAASAGRK